MFYLEKRIEIAGSHSLNLPYESPCQRNHGHNWIITVYCKTASLDASGMIVDFKQIKETVNQLDHQCLNDFLSQPTAENIAQYIQNRIPHCYKVRVQESEGNIVEFTNE